MNRANVYFPRSADEGKKDKNKNRVCSYQYAHHCIFEKYFGCIQEMTIGKFKITDLAFLAIKAQWGKTLYEIAVDI